MQAEWWLKEENLQKTSRCVLCIYSDIECRTESPNYGNAAMVNWPKTGARLTIGEEMNTSSEEEFSAICSEDGLVLRDFWRV